MSSLSNILKRLPSEGLFDLSPPGTITIGGADAKQFLQGQLSCNLQEITPSQSRLGAYCDIKGRAVGLFRLIQIDQQYHLLMDQEIIELVAKTLRRYAVFSKVTVDTASVFSQRIGVMGLDALSADQRELLSVLSLPQHPDETISAGGYTVVKIPGAEPRWEVLVQSPATPLKVPTPQDPAVWEAHNILCGLPTLKAATSGQFTTHKLGLIRLNAVSLNKGCYLGQEIIARTQYLGTQKGGLYWASVEPPHTYTPNTEILDAQQQLIGHVVESSTIDNHFTLILAALKQTPHQDDTYFIAKTPTSLSIPFTDEFA